VPFFNRLIKVVIAFALLAILPFSAQAFAQEQIMLEAASDEGTFTVEITWTPADIGNAHSFDIRFIEPETGVEIEDVVYDFSIYKDGDREELRRDQATARQEFTFDEQGQYEIRVDNIDGLGEGVEVPIQVTPEFPLGTLAVIAGALGVAMLYARRHRNILFSLRDK
jgi:hypothetical protein